MPRNVAHLLRTASSLSSQCRSLSATARRSNTDRNPNSSLDEPPTLSGEQLRQPLRAFDQAQIRETSALTRDLVAQIRNVQAHVASIPTTVQVLPEIPPYKLGYFKSQLLHPFSKAAEEAIKNAEIVLEHMRDLQYQPYKGKEDSPIVQFERELKSLSTKEKEEKMQQLQRVVHAQSSRPLTAAQSLLQDLKELGEAGGVRVTKVRNPFGAKGEAEVEEVDEESAELEAAGEDQTTARPAQPAGQKNPARPSTAPAGGLTSLQQQLQNSIDADGK